jgi:hypothetical protein
MLDNEDGFYDDLPVRKGKDSKRSVIRKPKMSEAEKQLKFEKLLKYQTQL